MPARVVAKNWAWPIFMPRSYRIAGGPPVVVGDRVVARIDEARQVYVITAIHDDGTADLTAEKTT